MPHWALTLVYFLHLSATVAWLGSLVGLTLLVIPAASKVLDPKDQVSLLDNLQTRLEFIKLVLFIFTDCHGHVSTQRQSQLQWAAGNAK